MRWTIPNTLTVLRLFAALALPLSYVAFFRPTADVVALVLFIGAALTDYVDGHLARAYGQESRFGAMLDPIADKAMVLIALATILSLWDFNALLMIPTAMIFFREVFVSGLREFLGADAGKLAVTKLAKWKTTAQMVAIVALFAVSFFEGPFFTMYNQDPGLMNAVLDGRAPDDYGLTGLYTQYIWVQQIAIALLWIAGLLTAITGVDYFRKALPFLKEEPGT